MSFVGARGIEPLLKEPKTFVLPLYDTPIQSNPIKNKYKEYYQRSSALQIYKL